MEHRFKADIAAQARKKATARQKEAERRQVETLNRKHLAGLRVLQKNLVYVMGMDVSGSDEDIMQTLRGPQHFGQYGKIVKIVASKAKEGYAGHHSTGIYVTFASKDDAKSCIAALDGSLHEGRVLRYDGVVSSKIDLLNTLFRAQYGTTKYCSAFLRNETCSNRNCMFLHETGEDSDSFSRQDLSSLNAVSTQRLAPSSATATASKSVHQPAPQSIPSQMPSVTAASSFQPKPEPMSRSDSGDGSALPTTANWAKMPQIEQSRRSSHAASRATPSPKATNSKLSMPQPDSRAATPASTTPDIKTSSAKEESTLNRSPIGTDQCQQEHGASMQRLEDAVKMVTGPNFYWSLDRSLYDTATLAVIDNFPPLIDVHGGAARLAAKVRQEQRRQKLEEERQTSQTLSIEEDENLASGSLQLGGEPETSEEQNDILGHPGSGRRNLPHQGAFGSFSGPVQPFDTQMPLGNDFSNSSARGRSLTPQQQQNIHLFKLSNAQNDSILDQTQRSTAGSTSQHHSQLSNPFQAHNQLSALTRHGRQSSRYNFANDTSSSSASAKSMTNAQILTQQNAMMPQGQQKSFSSQPPVQSSLHTNYYSGIQGPPPGLKSSGTPPISGGGMFGQGHGFASAMGGSAGFGNSNTGGKSGTDDLVRDIIRGRSGMGNSLGAEAGKREFMFPSFLQKSSQSPAPAPSLSNSSQGAQLGALVDLKPKKKGKKHRHANTSSSGGGAIVDLADPSILQARMHQTGVGQGPYGNTQNQGGYNSHAMMYGSHFGGRWA